MSVTQYHVPKNLRQALKAAGLKNLGDASRLTASELCSRSGVGSDDFVSIALALSAEGLAFAVSPPARLLPSAKTVAALGLRRRTANCLDKAGVQTIEQLLSLAPVVMMGFRSFGAGSLADLYLVLDSFGLQPERPLSPEPADSQEGYCQEEKAALAQALDELASVMVHLTPHAMVRNVLQQLPDSLLDQPATCLLANPPSTSALVARVELWMAGLSERESHVAERRSSLANRDSLEAIGDDFDVTRERIRQLESRALTALAGDPLVRALSDLLVELAPICSPDQLKGIGLGLNTETGAVFAVARHLDKISTTAEILPVKVFGEELVMIGYSASVEEVENFLPKLLAENEDLRFGTIGQLTMALINGLTNPDGPLRSLEWGGVERIVDAILDDERLWKEGSTTLFAEDQRYIYLGTKAGAIESRILFEGSPITIKELEEFYDSAFADGISIGSAAHARRVTYLLHNNEDIIGTGAGLWSHRNLGAEPRVVLKDQMVAALERAGGELSLPSLIQQMIALDSAVRPETVTTYAHGGVYFQVQGGVVSARTGPPSGDPWRQASMFKVLNGEYEGHWSWQNIYSSEQMYKSSTTIPTALAGLLEVSISGDTEIRFPSGSALAGCSAANVYLQSRGGFRKVLEAAGVQEGDRYRIIVLASRSAVCERMDPVDKSNPARVLMSTLGLAAEIDAIDLVPEALGLDAYSYKDQDLIDRVNSRSAEFSQAYFTINPTE